VLFFGFVFLFWFLIFRVLKIACEQRQRREKPKGRKLITHSKMRSREIGIMARNREEEINKCVFLPSHHRIKVFAWKVVLLFSVSWVFLITVFFHFSEWFLPFLFLVFSLLFFYLLFSLPLSSFPFVLCSRLELRMVDPERATVNDQCRGKWFTLHYLASWRDHVSRPRQQLIVPNVSGRLEAGTWPYPVYLTPLLEIAKSVQPYFLEKV
jgi:hypothetical protein